VAGALHNLRMQIYFADEHRQGCAAAGDPSLSSGVTEAHVS
jgi:hypothetical protein